MYVHNYICTCTIHNVIYVLELSVKPNATCLANNNTLPKTILINELSDACMNSYSEVKSYPHIKYYMT